MPNSAVGPITQCGTRLDHRSRKKMGFKSERLRVQERLELLPGTKMPLRTVSSGKYSTEIHQRKALEWFSRRKVPKSSKIISQIGNNPGFPFFLAPKPPAPALGQIRINLLTKPGKSGKRFAGNLGPKFLPPSHPSNQPIKGPTPRPRGPWNPW